MTNNANNPIGVFDSGVGGLTVFKALRETLPHEDLIYLGDTARLPYGTKSTETVAQYALQAAHLLIEENIKMLVVACNTASAAALPTLIKLLPTLPVLGVIEPGAAAAAWATRSGQIAVLATEGTVRSGAYASAIHHHRPNADVQMLACNLLVALVEEGWCDGTEAEIILKRYLQQLRPVYDTLVLGCTHFPLLTPIIRKLIGNDIHLIDSASTTAKTVKDFLTEHQLLNVQDCNGQNRFLVTDSHARFERLAKNFLGYDVKAEDVHFGFSERSKSA